MFNKLKKFFLVNESGAVFKGMLTLLVGAGLARIVGLISMPVLARIYSPENYGVLALYISFVSILAPVMTLRYVQAIPLPSKDLIAFNLFLLCFKLIFTFSIILAVLFIFWGEIILGWFNMEVLIKWRWLIVLGVAGTALYELFSLWATRKRQYKIIAKTQFTQSLIGNLVKMGLGLLAFKSSGMIIGQFISQSAGIISFIRNSWEDFKAYMPKTQLSKERFVVRYYQNFVWFRLPSQFLMVLSVQSPIMIMAALYGNETTGQFSLAVMALSLPFGLISGAMSKAYYAEVARIGKKDIKRIKIITIHIQRKMFLIGLPIFLCLYFLSEYLFSIVFGLEWKEAGKYASILAVNMLFSFTSAPLIQVLNVIGSQLVFLFINTIRVLVLFLIFLVAYYFSLDPESFVVFYSSLMSFFFVLVSFYIFLSLR